MFATQIPPIGQKQFFHAAAQNQPAHICKKFRRIV